MALPRQRAFSLWLAVGHLGGGGRGVPGRQAKALIDRLIDGRMNTFVRGARAKTSRARRALLTELLPGHPMGASGQSRSFSGSRVVSSGR